jgi:N-acetyl-anhydromuramyl-L-alanine amidase AmpD
VAASCHVWRALVRAYVIPRERAMTAHSALDPENRNDPGLIWMNEHADHVLDHAFKALVL